ncbi:type II toxin-antitoxin system VapC family toxin [Rhizobium sp. P32RR-XVIII]|uniref:type II toxin-antitoxin system VapC family toxin n=1 Tax=Rhizobium sp. P32RR-XVIII TaxID=2726738 RepID=UPI001456A849|nr:type II toxin-antitoxin system VapC family toxin [Rhizobium sp. P32RR-XVIII]NLS04807.1 type II toxin-antitoxin system VapC family toxin [Rhizobium sp. P32RR-XVIII]
MFLLDTNIVSELRRAKPHGGVSAWLASVRNEDLAISSVSVGEIQRGVELMRERDSQRAEELAAWLDKLISSINVIALDAQCMIKWAQFMHRRSPALLADAMIAATASVYNLTVVTRDIGDFAAFPVAVFNPFEYKT